MRNRAFVAVTLITVSVIGMTLGTFSAEAAPTDAPTPSSPGASQVGFTVVDTASPTPSPSPGGRGSGGSGGGAGGGGTIPPVCVPSTKSPSLAASPVAGGSPLRLTPPQASQGSDVLVRGEGFQPGEKVVIALYSKPVKLGIFTVRTNGQVYAEVTIPSRTQLGSHTIQVTGFLDCRVAASTINVVSPRGSGSSIFPWIVWLIAGGGVGAAAIGILIAFLLGMLPKGAAIGIATRAAP